MATQRFPIRIGRRSAPLLRVAFGATADRAWVTLADGELTVRFGRLGFAAPIKDIEAWRIEGPWHWFTAIGVRHSLGRDDISFAGSPRGGVRLDLRSPVRWTVLEVRTLYVGVEDLDGFAAELVALGIEGEDARR
jgi:hypothetical protein